MINLKIDIRRNFRFHIALKPTSHLWCMFGIRARRGGIYGRGLWLFFI